MEIRINESAVTDADGRIRVEREIRSYLVHILGDVALDVVILFQDDCPDSFSHEIDYRDLYDLLAVSDEFTANLREVIETIIVEEQNGRLEPLTTIPDPALTAADDWINDACKRQQQRTDVAIERCEAIAARARIVYAKLHALDLSIRALLRQDIDDGSLRMILDANGKDTEQVVYDIDDEEFETQIKVIAFAFWQHDRSGLSLITRNMVEKLYVEQMILVDAYLALSALYHAHDRIVTEERYKLGKLRSAQTAIQDAESEIAVTS